MKTTLIVGSLAALATAVPTWGKWDKWTPAPAPEPQKDADYWKYLRQPFVFTSTYHVVAVPGEVIDNNNRSAPGQPNAIGYFNYGINAPLDTICYNITLVGVQGTYQSPARTATHIHQALKGFAGPPRLAFPNPVQSTIAGEENIRRSVGCLTGPFVTGLNGTNGQDTGTGFRVAQIEANPRNFFTDVHTNLFVPGAVRGQLG